VLCQPNHDNIRDMFLTAATTVLVDRPMPFVQLTSKRIYDVYKDVFWSLLTVPGISHLFQTQLPTPNGVASIIMSEADDPTNQVNCLHYLRQFVSLLDQEEFFSFSWFLSHHWCDDFTAAAFTAVYVCYYAEFYTGVHATQVDVPTESVFKLIIFLRGQVHH